MAVKFSDLTVFTAAEVSDMTDLRFPLDDLQGTPETKQMSMAQLLVALMTPWFKQTAIPSGADPEGLYFVMTGTYRGVYAWTGTEAVLITPFSIDGNWPV